jgi:formate C-acetyltransferase
MDVTQGGAKYNFTGVQAVGIADVADSLAAIEHVVFNTRQIDMNTLLRALKHNFNTEEPLRLTLWNKAPKYGNDVDDVDAYAEHVAEIYEAEVTKYTNPRGGQFIPGVYSIGTQVGFGRLVGALPSGRRAGEPFATGINPHQGCDLNGPTATMRSVTKLDHGRFANGVAFNLKLNPSWVRTTKGKKALAALIDAYFKIGGMHVHFNIIDKRTLLAAQKHPERYTDLLIRLGGFSARFIDLSKAHQDELISRTEHYGK